MVANRILTETALRLIKQADPNLRTFQEMKDMSIQVSTPFICFEERQHILLHACNI